MPARAHPRHGGKLTHTNGSDGPSSMSTQAATNPLTWNAKRLSRLLPSAFTNTEHYDQRPLQCIRCGHVPKFRKLLDDTAEGFVCRALGACAARAKENHD